ncbi:MAG: cytochrome c-type biogenesis CcmF C-terminal domain-containing protein [Polyangiaceae bacterium]
MWQSLPEFGTGVLYAILIAAAYTFALSIAAGAGRPRLLHAARLGAYGTIALVGLAVLTLAYAFVSHDFRLSYVARYSDRGMTVPYQIVALWGGQDGSLLWWLFLTAFFSGLCVRWLGRRYLELQPYVLATLMSIIGFYALLMVFAVNPFAVSMSGAPGDGQGLNYQLRNFYMIIHPPSLYIGFTSATVPFAFCVAALITGRLDNEWILATRKWMLFSWLFLTIGNVLGMMWAYEELGWGGDWAWDPVENAACLPWWTASAYVHSTMIQERRAMLKIWNVYLICQTFWFTIFGTFLTRSGLIASVHSFAQSSVGTYFLVYMGVLAAVSIALIVWRIPMLRGDGVLETVTSRETAFVMNNWALLGCGAFIAVATCWPLFSEFFLNYKSTVGPTFYNFWLPIPFVILLLLMCVAPLLGWRKTSPELLKKSFIPPTAAAVGAVVLHIALASTLRMPPTVKMVNLYPLPSDAALANMDAVNKLSAQLVHAIGAAVAWTNGKLPVIVVALSAFKLTVVVQEFARGIAARQRAALARKATEGYHTSFIQLIAKARRRYGGYIVHVGVVLVYLHFTGRVWGTETEASLKPGTEFKVDQAYTVKYVNARRETDKEKMSILADLEVIERGKMVERLVPGKNIYRSMGGQMSTEVARHITMRDDLYVTLANVDPETKIATFQFHVNPLAILLVIGAGIMIIGAIVSLWPEINEQEVTAFTYVRSAVAMTSSILFCLMLVFFPRIVPKPSADPPASSAISLQAASPP